MVQIRKQSLENGEIYHIFTRSIAKFIVFNDDSEYDRIVRLLEYYRFAQVDCKYSEFLELTPEAKQYVIDKMSKSNDLLAEIVAFCIMPTHIHIILKQVKHNGISKFMARVLNSYSRYFNSTHLRTGPLWSGRFKSVHISTDEQLLHLTRYIHLNPTSAGITKNPEDWEYSSYREYANTDNIRTFLQF